MYTDLLDMQECVSDGALVLEMFSGNLLAEGTSSVLNITNKFAV